MELPLRITFRNTEPVPDLEAAIRRRVDRLERLCNHITACRVVIDVPHRHHKHGNPYRVRLDITVPDEELVVNGDAAGHSVACDPEQTIREAFDAAGRLLEDYVRRRRKDVKFHVRAPHAKVRVVLPDQDHGFLETSDGREVYFHRNSVLGLEFDRLVPGMEVTFAEEAGEKGAQATAVRPVGRHHHAVE